MRSQHAAFLLHIAVGVAVVVVVYSSSALNGWGWLFLFLVGVPWLAGFLAFFGLPRTAIAWALPIVPLVIGTMLWLLAEWVSVLE